MAAGITGQVVLGVRLRFVALYELRVCRQPFILVKLVNERREQLKVGMPEPKSPDRLL